MNTRTKSLLSVLMTIGMAALAPPTGASEASVPEVRPGTYVPSLDAAQQDTLAGLIAVLNAPPTTIALAADGHCGASGECNFVECDIECSGSQTKECKCVVNGECGPFWDVRPAYDCTCKCFNGDPDPEPPQCTVYNPVTGGCLVGKDAELPPLKPKPDCLTRISADGTQSTALELEELSVTEC